MHCCLLVGVAGGVVVVVDPGTVVVVVGPTVVVVDPGTVVVVVGPTVVVVDPGAVVVVVGPTVVVVDPGAVVVVVGAIVVVVVGWVVVVVGAIVVVVVGWVVVVVGAIVVVVGAIVVVVGAIVVVVGAIVVVVGAIVVVVVAELVSVTKAAAGGVIICVVPGCEINPPLASTRGVVVPAGSNGAAEPDWAGPGFLAASKPVNTQKPVLAPGAPTPGLPPNGTLMWSVPLTSMKVAESTSMIPMLALPPATPLVVNALPVSNVESVNVRFWPVPIVAGPAAAVVATLMVALEPSAATALIVAVALIPPAVGPATNAPTSPARNFPAAAVSVVDPLVHETPVIWRPGLAMAANVCV
jgi:hypothetical protein